jgi:hypothetical protein
LSAALEVCRTNLTKPLSAVASVPVRYVERSTTASTTTATSVYPVVVRATARPLTISIIQPSKMSGAKPLATQP